MKTICLTFSISLLLFFGFVTSNLIAQTQTIVIPATSTWKYLADGSNQSTNWRTPSFSDAAWPSGQAELGFGDSPISTLTSGKIGYYFRKAISINNPSQYSNFTLKYRRDDGIVIYVNNVEVLRNNMPAGTILYNTTASTTCPDDGNTIFTATIQSSSFANGINIISAEVHNQSTSSSDVTFELQLIANATTNPVCTAPASSSLSTTSITSNSAKISWTSIPGVVSYNVEYRIRNIGAAYSSPFSTTSTVYPLLNLLPLTDYEFIIQSVCSGNVLSPFSQSGWFTTLTANSPSTLIATNSNWKYLADGSNQGINWRTTAFNDTLWPSGTAELGFGDYPTTNLTSGKIGYYFRKYISLDPSQYSNFTIKFRRDDGIVVYVNNVEVIRNNMPQGAINYNTPAMTSCSDDGNTIFTTTIPNSSFVNGSNIIAAEVHNQSTSSSDITFELQMIGSPSSNACTPPNLLGTTTITSNSANLNWTAVAGILSYNLQYRIRNTGAAWSTNINTLSPSLVLNSLQQTTDYEFIAQSVCAGNALSVFTSSGFFTTIGTGSATLLRGPYMTVATSTSITIQWRTNTSTNSEVKYDTLISSLNNTANDFGLSTEHSIILNGLIPNKKYFYSIGSTGSVLQGDLNNYFYTAPANGDSSSLKFWVTGDFGNGSAGQLDVRNSFTNYTSGQLVNGWIWLGDNAYQNGTDLEYQTNVFNVYNSILKTTPLFPVPGNHDYAQIGYQSTSALGTNFPYFNIFSLPSASGTEKYYSTNYGNIHFIALDSYGSLNNSLSQMYNWLNNDLANNTQLWTIVFFHHPPYSKSHHNSDTEIELVNMRNNIVPLLESYGVDLVMSGHSHNYERSFLIKNHFGLENTFNSALYPNGNIVESGGGPYTKSNDNGTVYVVCGSSSSSAGSTQPGFPHDAMYRSIITGSGSLILNVNGGQLNCKYLMSDGTIGDDFTIIKTVPAPIPYARISKNTNEDIAPIIYPNPTTGEINIRMNNSALLQIKVSIYNMTRMLVYETTSHKSISEDVRIQKSEVNWGPGVYMVNVSGEGFNVLKKVVVY